MSRVLRSIATVAALFAPALVSPIGRVHPATVGRVHRLHLAPAPLATSLTVDEKEWSVTPSQTVVAAGPVRVTVYNRGQDMHDLVIQGPGGIRGQVPSMLPGASATIVVHLTRGSYLFYCSMFAGTPESHEMLGMHAIVKAR